MFPEYLEVLQHSQSWQTLGTVRNLSSLKSGSSEYSIFAFSAGSESPNAPHLIFTAGIHGLEKIGTQVALSFMSHLEARLPWDELLQEAFRRIRISFLPLLNPIGMAKFRRANGNGVDLMRNAPISSTRASPGVGGQSFSSHFPWFRGNPDQTHEGMELESRVLVDWILSEASRSSCILALDLHSGFGSQDQLWFPYAKSKEPFGRIHQIHALSGLLDQVMPNHVYRFEPQARHYTTHGDLWDYLIERIGSDRNFLPLTLEMGSWNWVRKNPLQIFSLLGPFNPIKPHRMKRAMRRHLPLLDFLIHCTASHPVWTGVDVVPHRNAALARWPSIES
ncbi:MAG: DUF2817 domain-containing protein [Bdellovibrionales bacterium]|nr:DUF2817 domain-containing protein [Bdellovibrionales bacterium]